jgi:hypothetical protein
MSINVAYCGIGCSECPTFLATQANDDNQRADVARQWSKLFNMEIQPKDINCDGCQSTSDRLFGHCQVCEIRKCAQDKAAANCAHCDEYACEKLSGIFALIPDAKKTLDEIKAKLS